METSEIIQAIETLHEDARRRGLFFQHATDEELRGRWVTVGGRRLVSFGSCSYLGLEQHPALIEGAIDALRRYGTQFSCSRGFLSAPLYQHLESTLDEVFEAHALVTATTTLGHSAAFDALMSEKDAIVLDHQVHQSVHQAASLARVRGAHVELVRHEELEQATEVITRLARRYRTVWFCTDGVLSMYGDLAPFAFLRHLLSIAPNVRLYVDDAHGMSWRGKHGRGSFLSHLGLDPRVVVATSLSKAFGCGGGALVFADRRERERVRMCGGTLLFSGPLQPPVLGAALASARLHLTDELVTLQGRLRERVLHTNRRLAAAGLPLLVDNDVPIRFVRLGLPRLASEVAERAAGDGFYLNVSMFPTVPMRRAGLRLSINANHDLEHIDALVDSLARHVPEVLASEGMTVADLDALFARAVTSGLGAGAPSAPAPARRPARPAPGRPPATPDGAAGAPASGRRPGAGGLRVEHVRSIAQLDGREWDSLLGTAGMISADAMACAERVFRDQPRREHNWTLDYVIVRDAGGRPVGATVFQTALQKDDFIMRDVVSRAVEERRRQDPYFLTSVVVMTGTTLSEGHHVYLDRAGPWREAMALLVRKAVEIYEREGADAIMLRDLPGDDPAMDALLLGEGLLRVPMLDSHVLPVTWSTPDELLAGLGRKSRAELRPVFERSGEYVVRAFDRASGPPPAAQLDHLWGLYRSLVQRKFRINVFELPSGLLSELLRSESWELVTLSLPAAAGGPSHGQPIAWFTAHRHAGHYGALVAGLDHAYVPAPHGVYRQILLQIALRARQLGMTEVHLGMDADTEKRRFRTRAVANCVYVQAREHTSSAILREIVAEVGAT